jgi:hypothetical protein
MNTGVCRFALLAGLLAGRIPGCAGATRAPRGAPGPRAFEMAFDVYLIDVENGLRRRGGHGFDLLVGGQRRPFGRRPRGSIRICASPRVRCSLPTEPASSLSARRIATARVDGARAAVLRVPPLARGRTSRARLDRPRNGQVGPRGSDWRRHSSSRPRGGTREPASDHAR